MTLMGQGFVAMWHDYDPNHEEDYQNWHTKEHMPERVGVPGFLRGRRYINHTVPLYRYFTLYEADSLEAFVSEAYQERLNNPTEWSLQVQPRFRNFLRTTADLVTSEGLGIAKQLLTVRIFHNDGSQVSKAAVSDRKDQLHGLMAKILAADRVSTVHYGIARPEYSQLETTETKLRGEQSPQAYDELLMVEGVDKVALGNIVSWLIPELEEILGDIHIDIISYELDYVLTAA